MATELTNLTADDILNADDMGLEPVVISRWKGRIFVPVMSLDDLQKLEEATKNAEDKNCAVAVQVIRDQYGSRLFADNQAPALRKKFGGGIMTILKRFNEVNGLSDEAQENIAKN